MRLGSSWPLLALLALAASSSRAPSSPQPLPSSTGEVQRVRTGPDGLLNWFGERFGMALELLPALGVPDVLLRPVALSIVAQWAHETNRGKSEFNFNLGGWHTLGHEPYFTARDVLTGPQLIRWSAWTDLRTAVSDQLRRLATIFPSAWRLLLQNPLSSAWIEELGRRGYYPSANRTAYAHAWAMQRAELGRLAA